MKRIAIFMDGTWQRLSQEYPTNVAKLLQSVASEDESNEEQIVYYGRGVGARGETMSDKASRMLAGGITGAGLEDALLDAYLFLACNYEPGDKIYIFGFSRGAFTARSLGGMIRKCGILKRIFATRVQDAYEHYYDKDLKADDSTMRNYRATHSIAPVLDLDEPSDVAPISIEYMGIFDTVGQRGVPIQFWMLTQLLNSKYRFHDLSLGTHVLSARHAVSIDEERKAFPVTLWDNLDERNTELNIDPLSDEAPFQQRWFPGGHGEIGGGVNSLLPNLTLCWVAAGAAARGLKFDDDDQCVLKLASVEAMCNPAAPFSYEPPSLLSILGRRARAIRKFKRKAPAEAMDVRLNLSSAAISRWRAGDLEPLYRPRTLRALKALLDEKD